MRIQNFARTVPVRGAIEPPLQDRLFIQIREFHCHDNRQAVKTEFTEAKYDRRPDAAMYYGIGTDWNLPDGN